MARRTLTALTVLLATAVAGSVGQTVRDSAGIRIVENDPNAALPRRDVSPEPVLTIGMWEGPQEYLFYRVAAAYRLEDGRFVVANGGSTEFRFYGPDGRFERAAGGPGGGPGEMRVLFEVTLLAGDTLVAFDGALARLDWFDAQGEFIERTSAPLEGLVTLPYFSEGAHVLSDRTILLRMNEFTRDLPEGRFRPRLGFLRWNPASGSRDTLGWSEGLENFVIRVDGRTQAGVPPFARRTVETWNAGMVYIADTDRFEIQAVDLATGRRSLIRMNRPGPSFADDDWDRFERRYRDFIERNPQRKGRLARWLAAVKAPDTKPPIQDIRADRQGRVWVAETPPVDGGPLDWVIFERDGRASAVVQLPGGYTPFDIGDDYVVGRWMDDDQVEFVLVYRLGR